MSSLWNSIITMFDGLSAWGWVGQICGLIGFSMMLVAFQCNKKNYCLVAGFAMILFIIESTTSKASMANFMVCLMSLIRNLWMYVRIKKGQGELTNISVWLLLIFMWSGQIFYMTITKSFLEISSYFTVVTSTILTLLQNNKNYYIVKLGNLIQESGALALFIICGLPFSIFRQIILVTSILISVAIMVFNDVKRKKEMRKND